MQQTEGSSSPSFIGFGLEVARSDELIEHPNSVILLENQHLDGGIDEGNEATTTPQIPNPLLKKLKKQELELELSDMNFAYHCKFPVDILMKGSSGIRQLISKLLFSNHRIENRENDNFERVQQHQALIENNENHHNDELLGQRSTQTIVKPNNDGNNLLENQIGVTFVVPHDLSFSDPSMNQYLFEQFSHQSLLSWNWNSKADHTQSVFSMMQYYYGPFKVFLLFMVILIFTTICMVSLVKVSSLGKHIENVLFETVRTEALKVNHSASVTSILKTAPAIKTIIYLTLFLIATILIILITSIYVMRLILIFIRRRVLQKFAKTKKAFNLEVPPPREKLDLVLYDDNYNGTSEEKISQAVYGYIQLSKRLIVTNSNSSILSQKTTIQSSSSSQELAISNFVLEHMMKSMIDSHNSSSSSSPSSSVDASITTSNSIPLLQPAIIEIEHFLLKEQIPTFSKPHEYHASNFSIAQEFLLIALAMARKEVMFKNCGFVLIRVPSVQYGMMRLCEQLGFTMIHQQVGEFPMSWSVYMSPLN
ncbi:hypothetical protein C9374_009811 [Naegleria lovaniensis]|uniref:Uncharacterized protein n=1 Tax=Naegleria lovaniensis TaxID=51637 RepID=A0AA88KS23_NAELO|nr:uncharacterized protein C9374_009811 [Naegleria lovaniensis]KAG2393234.1 hypothetical protein C9374_009811 [Naegleria lovaniensis]